MDGVNSGANKGARFCPSVFQQFCPYRSSCLCNTDSDTKKRVKRHSHDTYNIIYPNSATSAERGKIWRLFENIEVVIFSELRPPKVSNPVFIAL